MKQRVRHLGFLSATFCVATALPSHAGWVIDHYEGQGTNTATPNSTNPNGPIPFSISQSGTGAYNVKAGSYGQNNKSSAKGTITAVFKWVPAAGEPSVAPTSIMSIMITSEVSASVLYADPTSSSLTVDNGLQQDDPITFNQSYPYGSYQAGKFQTGKKLIQERISAGETEFRKSVTVEATAYGAGNAGPSSANIAVTFAFNDRRAFLNRVGEGTLKYWDDPTLNKAREGWIDKEGNRHGHSRVSYTKRTGTTYGGFTDEQIKILQYFQGSRSGSWSSNVTESWLAQSAGAFDTGANPPSLNLSPFKNGGSTATVQILNPIAGSSIPTGILHNQAGLTTDSNNVVIPAPLGAGWYYEPWGPGIWGPGAECIISYDVRDQADNAKARATYTLTLHNQWENKRDDWNHSWTDANGTLHLGNKLFTRAYFDDPEVSFTNNNTNGTSQTFSWTFGSIPAFTFGGDLSTDFNRHDYTKFGAHSGVGTTIDLSVPNGGSVTLQPGETAVPYVQVTWHRRYWLVDQFGINGFIGESSKWYDDIPAAIEAKWWITDANSTNNPPRPSTTPHQIQ
jgi:hypothetical protein